MEHNITITLHFSREGASSKTIYKDHGKLKTIVLQNHLKTKHIVDVVYQYHVCASCVHISAIMLVHNFKVSCFFTQTENCTNK